MNARLVSSFSAERTSLETVRRQADLFSKSPVVSILDRLPMGVVVFNVFRQIVYANAAFRTVAADGAPGDLLGLRLGEALSCTGSKVDSGVCGTTELCRSCGAAQALAKTLGGQDMAGGECSISRCGVKRLENLDFRIWVWSMQQGGDRFQVTIMADIRAEKRLELMERIFYHDVLNIVSGMQGICELMHEEETEASAELDLLLFAVGRVTELIVSQRDFSLAEHGDYEVVSTKMGTHALLTDITALMRQEPSCRGKTLRIAPESVDAFFASDRKLLLRILVNMQKNALEATPAGGEVMVGCALEEGAVRFWVHNDGVVPEAARPQIFRRAFSTKGRGRGLGTYGMKLFAETYLGGKVGFTTDATAGTTFFVRLPLGA